MRRLLWPGLSLPAVLSCPLSPSLSLRRTRSIAGAVCSQRRGTEFLLVVVGPGESSGSLFGMSKRRGIRRSERHPARTTRVWAESLRTGVAPAPAASVPRPTLDTPAFSSVFQRPCAVLRSRQAFAMSSRMGAMERHFEGTLEVLWKRVLRVFEKFGAGFPG